jgi:geranylgeranyl reductase family protein
MPTNRYDVVVVGAGPAGSTAALTLARAGKRVALLDRASFPRAKICGNCINPSAWQVWEKLGLTESFRALPHAEIAGFTIECEGRLVHRETFRPPMQGPRAVARDVLDDWLRREGQAAGVEFFPETTVTGIDPDGMVKTSAGDFHARLIFGADGRNSIVARHSGLMPPPQRCHRIAWQATIPAPPELDRHVHMQVFEEGYFGYCRYSADRAVVSLVLDARRSQDPQAAARRFFPHFPEEEWLRMNPITRAPAGVGKGRVWLIGDSARVVEPFTGEGISFALATALMAAETALKALRHDRIEPALKSYAQRHRRLYAQRAWVNTLVRWLLIEPWRTVRVVRRVPLPGPLVSLLARRVLTA